jgi:ubiquinone/menaquinone biosynthesis C-methylase UbiE
MSFRQAFQLADVQSVYAGPEARLWELLMGQQIHIGGFKSSMDLAQRAGLQPGFEGVDLCCATGAGMRFLTRFQGGARMTGVDATPAMLELGRQRCTEEGLSDRIRFVEADVCQSGLASSQFDLVWGEDAWCYVQNKSRLIAEACRLAKLDGVIAFTDWMEGAVRLQAHEAERFLKFMTFPNLFRLEDYASALKSNGWQTTVGMDTKRFARHTRLYIDMLEQQLTYDALKIIGFDTARAESLLNEMRSMQSLAESGKIIQGLVVARHRG